MGKYEVTQAQYEVVMKNVIGDLNATPSSFHGFPNRPVDNVSHDDAQVFLERLNAQEAGNIPKGWAYVLPTEAQWEYACRAGTNTRYSWGDSITSSNANYATSGHAAIRDVGQYPANPWGFYDMHGNLWEWTADWFKYLNSDPQVDPNWIESGSLPLRITKGGSRLYGSSLARSAYRDAKSPDIRRTDLGFRLSFQYTNKPPTDLNSTADLTIAENQPIGTSVGQFNATDPEGGAVTFILPAGENNNSLFALDTNGTLKTATTFDYESNAFNYLITVQAKDELNATTEGNFTVTLLDVYEDTDGDGFRDSLEASTGSDLNDPNSTPLQQGLVAWYPFDGNASDMSGNGNHGTVNGATLGTDRHGEAGKAYSFDGVDDFIRVAHSDRINFESNDPFSITVWIYASGGNPEHRSILEKWEGGTPYPYAIRLMNGGRFSFGRYDLSSGETISGQAEQFDYGFTQLVVAGDGYDFSSFINGKLDKTMNIDLGTTDNASDLYIGRRGTNDAWYFNGLIDDIRIYDRALSEDEIELLYRAESPNHFVNSAKDLEMIWVEPGTFTMGQTGVVNAETEHNVTLTQGFYFGKYEVTQAQYEAVMTGDTGDLNATPSNWQGTLTGRWKRFPGMIFRYSLPV